MLILKARTLEAKHGFFGRQGGVSEGIYASLNCGPGSGDDRKRVLENRKRAIAALNPQAELVTMYQVHGAQAVTVTEPWDIPQNPKADALVTDKKGIALGILTADCAPILLADREAHVIGAAHAGWNGAISGVTDSVVAAMVRLGAKLERIRAAIGPCISQAAYEVGPEFEARFRAADAKNTRFFIPSERANHWQFDLPAYVAHGLEQAGVKAEIVNACTYASEADFFSYRRTTHRKEPDYGRELSAIVLED
ncbi:MAG TPA: peptidoglycan editing factor PgeF [Micropepsaceae bacterium]|nr:peptidoglycan editing factor PgeF [Micropepsaceae bacterium]